MIISRRSFFHSTCRLLNPSFPPFSAVPISLSEQTAKIEKLMREVVIPADLTYPAAHTKPFRRSIAMEIWMQDARHRASKIKPFSYDFLSDKKELIENISRLQQQGFISLSQDLLIVAEGCDNGHYLPFLCAALTRDGIRRNIRLFLTNGSPEIIQRAAQVGYRALRAIG